MPKRLQLKNAFAKWYFEKIGQTARNEAKLAIETECKISQATFYSRLQNPSAFSPVEQKFIADLAGRSVEELFPAKAHA